ncbi:hypothetical protein [Salinibacillus kushneri]|nr:hypothetical protein [Salinibacillus kushneri]
MKKKTPKTKRRKNTRRVGILESKYKKQGKQRNELNKENEEKRKKEAKR